jgi:hypothetical protein
MNDTHCVEGVASADGWSILDDSLGARWGGAAPVRGLSADAASLAPGAPLAREGDRRA